MTQPTRSRFESRDLYVNAPRFANVLRLLAIAYLVTMVVVAFGVDGNGSVTTSIIAGAVFGGAVLWALAFAIDLVLTIAKDTHD